ncbi:retropepsin-like aspartic protease [Psychroserpens luteolus]|uniref:retropepsin-like aspartic protease n=1 Tax=Psychroserpens luteolus TaxID=2855840 RepID=UPI001E441166|nr:retropepsin-like aspartic protease [Psychroserpens luteolus]MCD2257725.1 retroviral-like aspartic protease family protein [Psychroserpens luteolus]
MKKNIITFIICNLFLWSSCQSDKTPITPVESNNRVVIPVDISSRRPILDVTINGKGPYKFIFDTGSSTTVIDERLSNEFSFKQVSTDTIGVQGSDNKLITQTVLVPKVSFPHTNIIKDVNMNVLDLRSMLPIDGVLSGVFFEDYLVTMDYPKSKIILTNGTLNKDDKDVTKIIENPNVLSYNLIVDGIIVEAHLDTGSPGGFSLPYALKDKLNLKGEMREGTLISTPAASFKPWHAELLGTIQLGELNYENPDIVLVENFEYANFGYTIIKDLKITIDRTNNLIRFEKPKREKAIPYKKEQLGDGSTNEFTGSYEGGREVFLENGQLFFQRQGYKFRLEKISKDLYKLVYSIPVNNELPNARFERNESNQIKGLTFIFKNGKEEFRKKEN